MKVKHNSSRSVRFSAVASILALWLLSFPLVLGESAEAIALFANDPVKICEKPYTRLNFAMVTDEHKICLDDLKDKLTNVESPAIVIDGHRDKSETQGISLTRVNHLRDYLVEDVGIDAMMIVTRNFGDTCPADKRKPEINRRFQIWVVPKVSDPTDINAISARIRPLKLCAESAKIITTETPAPAADSSR
jgi:hypothetical protein